MKLVWISKLSELDPSHITLAKPGEEHSVFSNFPPFRYWDLKNQDVL